MTIKNLSLLSQTELLQTKISALNIAIEKSAVYPLVKQLYSELENKELNFKPHVWFSTEWFCPDGIPGFAIPLYLAHPKLLKLEKKIMMQAEGEAKRDCLKILRHEAAHAIDNAFRLHKRKKWREIFGSYTAPYPTTYQPRPNSRKYVLHLDSWYAQAHPAEDFAETFAVWLNPKSNWRQIYQGWPALKKLEYIDDLMSELKDTKQIITSKKTIEAHSKLNYTLDKYFQNKKELYSTEQSGYYDLDLRKIFSDHSKYVQEQPAAQFIRQYRVEVREMVAGWTGAPSYSVDQILQEVIERAQSLKLRRWKSKPKSKRELTLMIAVQTMNVIHHAIYKFAL